MWKMPYMGKVVKMTGQTDWLAAQRDEEYSTQTCQSRSPWTNRTAEAWGEPDRLREGRGSDDPLRVAASFNHMLQRTGGAVSGHVRGPEGVEGS